MNIDENGIPQKYQINYDIKDASFTITAKHKYKFAETTFKQSARERRENEAVRPIAMKIIRDGLKKKAANLVEKENKFTFSYSEEIPCSTKVDKKGNWTEITLGDFTITRQIKY